MKFKLLLALSLVFLLSSCSTLQITSDHATQWVLIDGLNNEWSNRINYFKDENVGIAFQNDDDYLYMCLQTNNRMRMMDVLMRGLIIWFDSDDRAKTFGVKFPIPDAERFRDNMLGPVLDPSKRGEHDKMISNLITKQKEIQIVNEDDYSLYLFSIKNNDDFDAALNFDGKTFLYELKVPLHSGETYLCLNSIPGDLVNVNIESGEMKLNRPARPGPGEGNRPRNSERMGGRRPSANRNIPERPAELDLEFEVRLSPQS